MEAAVEIFKSFNFEVACVIMLGAFSCGLIYKILQRSKEEIAYFQNAAEVRENKLYNEIQENRVINQKAIETIAKYSEKLDNIQQDVDDIKTSVTVLSAKHDFKN